MSRIYHVAGNAKIAFEWIIKIDDSGNIADELKKSNKFLEDIKDAIYDYGVSDIELHCENDEWCFEDNVGIDLTKGE